MSGNNDQLNDRIYGAQNDKKLNWAEKNNNTPTSTKVSKPKKMKMKSAKNLKGKKIKLTWKKINGKTYAGSWSTKKTVKVRK